jgi:hypothetical protein
MSNGANTSAQVLSRAAWAQLREDPAKAAGIAYVWLTAVGFAHLFGSGMAFGLNVIDLASPSDFLLAGLRDPVVTLLAALSGWGLYWLWGKSLRSVGARRALVPAMLALLVAGAWTSGWYRRSVVTGALQGIGPLRLAIAIDGQDGPLTGVKLAVATSEFWILGTMDEKTIILPKGSIKRVDVVPR